MNTTEVGSMASALPRADGSVCHTPRTRRIRLSGSALRGPDELRIGSSYVRRVHRGVLMGPPVRHVDADCFSCSTPSLRRSAVGLSQWYRTYRVRIAAVERDHGLLDAP